MSAVVEGISIEQIAVADKAAADRVTSRARIGEIRPAPELTVVVPTFNEGINVPALVEHLRAALTGIDWELLVVDDDSPDGTTGLVKRIGAADARVRCLRRIGRRGLAGAAIEGMMASQAPFVAVMDADLQHDETILPAMLERLRAGFDLAVGTRDGGGAVDGFAAGRRRVSALGTRLAAGMLRVELSDPMSGFFAIRREAVEELAPRLSTQGFKILLDIVACAHGRLRIAEVGYAFRARRHGESKLDGGVAFAFLALLIAKASNDLLSVRFLWFCLVGLSGLGVHMIGLAAALRLFDLGFTRAEVAATLLAITSNYVLNNAVTYSDRKLRGWRFVQGWVEFTLICGIGALSNVGVARWIYAADGAWAIAGLAGGIIGVTWNFLVSALFVWRVR